MEDKLKNFYAELATVCKECGRSLNSVKVLYATKYLNSQELASFIDHYQHLRREKLLIGENRIQAAKEKFKSLQSENIIKVMIGNLQKNKINKALTLFDEI